MTPIHTSPNKSAPWTHFGWPKKVGNFDGVRGFIKHEMHSGLYRIPAGTKVKIRQTNRARAIRIETDACDKCGISCFVTRVHFRDIEVTDWPDADEKDQDPV